MGIDLCRWGLRFPRLPSENRPREGMDFPSKDRSWLRALPTLRCVTQNASCVGGKVWDRLRSGFLHLQVPTPRLWLRPTQSLP